MNTPDPVDLLRSLLGTEPPQLTGADIDTLVERSRPDPGRRPLHRRPGLLFGIVALGGAGGSLIALLCQ